MLERYHTSLELTNEALAYMKKNDADPADTAEWFLKTHADLWGSWVQDPDAKARISKALN